MAKGALDTFAEQWLPLVSGRALVVGSRLYEGSKKTDRRLLYSEAIGIDLQLGDGVDLIHDLEDPLPADLGTFDHVDCASVLEHVRRPWKMAENIEAALNPGGTLYVCVPFVWRVHAYPSDYWRLTREALDVIFPNIEWSDRRYAVGHKLHDKVRGVEVNGYPCMPRSELVAFGVKCA